MQLHNFAYFFCMNYSMTVVVPGLLIDRNHAPKVVKIVDIVPAPFVSAWLHSLLFPYALIWLNSIVCCLMISPPFIQRLTHGATISSWS
jgi:hypothetical protein